MAKKSLGHVELQWTCPNCQGINPGPVKTCQACGSPQPEDVQFEQAERQELVTDEEKIASAEAGADIHCPYCGTRNPAKAEVCTQCGGDIKEGIRRQSGQVVGAFQTGPVEQVACPRCGAKNPDTARACSQCGSPMHIDKPVPAASQDTSQKKTGVNRIILIGAVIALVILCAVTYFAFFSTNDVNGTVKSVQWQRSIPIEALGPVEYQAWIDEIPSNAVLGVCREELHHVQSDPAPNSVEVCGTPYNVDTGGGFAEVVQDCQYEVYEDYCEFTVEEWVVVETVQLTGSDYNPEWPEPILDAGERLGSERQASYVILFETDDGIERFTTSSLDLFQQAQIGTNWTLEINPLGGIVRIER